MVLKYSFKPQYFSSNVEFMINAATQGSNRVNGKENTSTLLIFKVNQSSVRMAQLYEVCFPYRRKLGCRFKSWWGYFQFCFCFFSFIIFLPFGLFPFILTADPFQLCEIFAITYFYYYYLLSLLFGVGNKVYYGQCEQTNFNILKFILGSGAWRNKTNEMYYSLLCLKMISFVLFLQASQPSMNFKGLWN